jgi:hypothetical protein
MKKGLEKVTEAIMAATAPEKKDKGTQADILIEIAREAELFHTPETEPYAEVPVGVHSEIWPLRSKGFRRWLIAEFFRLYEKPPRNQALQDAIALLEARAHFDSPECPLHVRIGDYEGRIYIDLGDDQHRAVEISEHGWRVIGNPPVRFRRTRSMKALPEPRRGGSIQMLRRFLNLGSENNWILCLAWLVSACRPKGPYPILIFQGEQGSAKSTTERLLRRLIDPSVSLIRTPPRDDRDLLITASNSWVIAYDNLSGVAPWLSDALCRLATGGGFSTRELYTDSEEVFFDAMRPVILNGIDHLAERADLADRALILNLPPIEESRRKDEAQLYAEFERDLPKILGALCSVLSGTLARLADTHLERKPRMADFALVATAAEEPLGLAPGTFMQAYSGNRAEAIQETLDADPLGAALLTMMDTGELWDGTCKELLLKLEGLVDEGTKRSREWPKSPRSVSGRLRRLATFLRESGIHVTFPLKGAKGRRILTIRATGGETIATTATSATQSTEHTADQSDEPDKHGGDHAHEVANSLAHLNQSPPPANTLNEHEEKARGGGCGDHFPTRAANGRNGDSYGDSCPQCGPTDWQRLGRVLVCSNCGQEKQSQNGDEPDDLERFAV